MTRIRRMCANPICNDLRTRGPSAFKLRRAGFAVRGLDEMPSIVYAVIMNDVRSDRVAFIVREIDAGCEAVECRPGCGACCIAPSISTPIPGMPEGKPAGVRCRQLTADNRCKLFGKPERPAVCVRLRPTREMCGESDEAAMIYLTWLEAQTQ